MAYAAVTSLYHTIDLLLSSSHTSIDPSSLKTLKYARWVAARLQRTLRNYDAIKNSSEEVLAVDARIRDEARKLEETIESEASSQFLSQSQSHGRFSLHLSHLSHHVSRFLNTAEVMGAEYVQELEMPREEEGEEEAAAAAAKSESDGTNRVGFDDLFVEIRHRVVGAAYFKCIAITGMAGIVTSRIDGIGDDYNYRMRFLNEVESWELLQRKVFGEDKDEYSCPRQLVKAGKKIAENCEGLPLLILSVARLLVKAPKEVEYWEEVAKMRNSVMEDACDLIHEILLTSYHYLSQHSKACFLYMCIFPKGYLVCRSKINNLWLAEGFVDGVGFVLDEIVSSNLVVTRSRNWGLTRAKACSLHIVYRHLSRRVAEDNKFVFVLNTYEAGGPSEERIRDKPHLAVQNNSLLAMKEVHASIARVSTLRSMLCTGPYHLYQVPVCMELKLLRVLDAVTIRFYEFPVEVVKLIQLRYLSLTTNSNLPPSINKLWFLEYLIVHQHLSIINRSVAESCSYVPSEIWELEQLKYLELVGRNLPVPPPGGILSNLTTLLDVGAQSCAVGVLESIPKLEKLRIRIESAPDLAPTMIRFDDVILERLKSLASMVVNPKLLRKPVSFPPRLRLSTFMSNLHKLSLSGFGYPWEDMSMIAKLSNLKVLKLQCYAFRGQRWAPDPGMRFEDLKYLLIEDTDLTVWVGADESFPKLTHLTMKNCHRLHVFPLIKTLTNIQLVDCNTLAEAHARRASKCDVRVECSWK